MSGDKKDTGFAGLSGLTSDQFPPSQPLVPPIQEPSQIQVQLKKEHAQPQQASSVPDTQTSSTKANNVSKYRIISIILGVVCLVLVVLLVRSCSVSDTNFKSTPSRPSAQTTKVPTASTLAASVPAISVPKVQEQPIIVPSKAYRPSTLSDDFTGEYHTSKHSIRIIKAANGKYIYIAWKQPLVMDEGKPTLMLTSG